MSEKKPPSNIDEILTQISEIQMDMEKLRENAFFSSCAIAIGRINAALIIHHANIVCLTLQATMLIAKRPPCTNH